MPIGRQVTIDIDVAEVTLVSRVYKQPRTHSLLLPYVSPFLLFPSPPLLPGADKPDVAFPYRLVGFFDEDKGRPLHNGRAGTNEGDLDIFDLAFPSPS